MCISNYVIKGKFQLQYYGVFYSSGGNWIKRCNTPSFDLPGIDIENNNIHCGSGPVLNICDRIAYYDKNFINLIIDISKRHQIPFQMKTEISGATDAAAIQILKNGMKTITISIPCRYMHSPSTIINMDDFKNTYKLVYEFIKEFQKS
ncbi:Putative aminopeptidase ysdC [Clostridioides difficile]|nr:Putative aminopeptidase ysdC [Clostridioides difficile]